MKLGKHYKYRSKSLLIVSNKTESFYFEERKDKENDSLLNKKRKNSNNMNIIENNENDNKSSSNNINVDNEKNNNNNFNIINEAEFCSICQKQYDEKSNKIRNLCSCNFHLDCFNNRIQEEIIKGKNRN